MGDAPSMLDLNILPLVRRAGQDQSSLPGLYAVNPPRRAARGRSLDQLILCLNIQGNAPLPEEHYHALLMRAAQAYYQTPGAVTSASRAAIEVVNQALLERNLRSSGSGRQGSGLLIVAVVRETKLYLSLAGPVHTYLLGAAQGEAQEFYDPENAGRPLGLSSALPVRYYQIGLQAADFVLLAPCPPGSWNPAALRGVYSQGLESLRRRLLSLAGTDVSAVLIQFQAGSGKMRLLWPKSAARESSAETLAAAPKIEPPPMPTAASEGGSPSTESMPPSGEIDSQAEHPTPVVVATPEAAPSAIPQPPTSTPSRSLPPSEAAPAPRRLNDATPRATTRRTANLPKLPAWNSEPLRKGLATVARTAARAGRGTLAFVRRLLPDESLFTIPTSTKIFIALAVPLVIALVGVKTYIERGRAAQAQVYYQKSLELAAQAQGQTDALLQRAAWQETLNLVSTAVAYKEIPEAKALQDQVSATLDQLDGVKRLEFQAAVQPLGETARITAMTATQDELFLLNGSQGSVRRAVLTSRGYLIDADFHCGPGPYGSRPVGKLIAIAPLPKGSEFNAALIGLDEAANLLYCIPREEPKAISLATPVVSGWGKITTFAFDPDTRNLYVLDASKHKVWIYQSLAVTEQPLSFFDETVDTLPNLEDVTALAANRTTLYFLHRDGQLTICEYARQEGSAAHCQNPATYQDSRPGRQNGPLVAEAGFTGLAYAPPPDPSIFMLDADHQAVYQFSLALNFYAQYRSSTALPTAPATAFAISPERIVFMAIGNQVFYARLMP